MKTAYFAFDIFAPSPTAGFIHTCEMCRCLARRVSLKLYSLPPASRILHLHTWRTSIDRLPVEYVRFTLWFKPYLLPLVPLNAVSYRRVSRQIADFKPDLVHERFHTPNPFGWRLAAKHGVPRILEVNSLYIEDGAYRNPLFNSIAKRDRATQFCHADAFITQTETLKKLLSRLTDAPIYVVPNGVNTEHFTPDIDVVSLRGKLGIPRDAVVVTFSGSYRDWHGVHLVPEIAEQVQREHPDVFFLFLGSGKNEQLLRRAGIRNAVFAGVLSYRELPAYLAASDICIAPFDASRFRYFEELGFWWNPLKLFEYMAAGKPTLSFDYPEIRKILQDGGVLAEVGDVEDFTDKLLQLIENPEKRHDIGRRARELAVAEYDWCRRADETLRVYESVVR